MLDGFFTDDVLWVDLARRGFDRPGEVTSVDLIVHRIDGVVVCPVNLGEAGINVETLTRIVRETNASLRRRRRGDMT